MIREIIEQAPPAHQDLGLPEDLSDLGRQVFRRHAPTHYLYRNHVVSSQRSAFSGQQLKSEAAF